jgi:hypothetical protein
LESEKKYTIPFARNYGYSPYDLNRFLRKGDAIEKRTGTDTLTVIRDDQVFVFLLDKVLGDNEVSDVIEPLFDIEIEQLLATYKEKCKAQSVRLSRPYVTSNGVTRYWLGIVFTDTELPKSDLNSFAREIGKDFFDHLKNKEAFDMLEIIVKEESGFIITFTETKSIRFTEILFRMFIHQMCHL